MKILGSSPAAVGFELTLHQNRQIHPALNPSADPKPARILAITLIGYDST